MIDRFFPSSQGWKNEALDLKDRAWTCAQRGAQHDRDHNAAKNILAEGLRLAAAEAASYPDRTGSVTEIAAGSTHRVEPDTVNRELVAKPAKRANSRRARMDRVKAGVA